MSWTGEALNLGDALARGAALQAAQLEDLAGSERLSRLLRAVDNLGLTRTSGGCTVLPGNAEELLLGNAEELLAARSDFPDDLGPPGGVISRDLDGTLRRDIDSDIDREAARRYIAELAIGAVEHALEHGRPDWAQLLHVRIQIPAAVAEAATRTT